ncbi:MAG TPA: hypothetical protein VK037_02675 [Pseudogracilibacillus sp.]|nr:hypothetical protein [Pseudogracilibacillus sp.]
MTISCGRNDTAPNIEGVQEQASETGLVLFPLEVTDATEKTIILKKAPGTIVSVMPSNTEILFV